MRLKKSKKEVLQDIINNTYPYVADMPDLSSIPPSQLKMYIQNYSKDLVRNTVLSTMQSLLDNFYTEEEFEQDIGLNSDKS